MEKDLYALLKRIGKQEYSEIEFQRHEDKYKEGIPDLSIMTPDGTIWCELKYAKKRSKKPSTTFNIRTSQAVWARRRKFAKDIFWIFYIEEYKQLIIVPNMLMWDGFWTDKTWADFYNLALVHTVASQYIHPIEWMNNFIKSYTKPEGEFNDALQKP